MHTDVTRGATTAGSSGEWNGKADGERGWFGIRGELLCAIIYGLIKFDVNACAVPCHRTRWDAITGKLQ